MYSQIILQYHKCFKTTFTKSIPLPEMQLQKENTLFLVLAPLNSSQLQFLLFPSNHRHLQGSLHHRLIIRFVYLQSSLSGKILATIEEPGIHDPQVYKTQTDFFETVHFEFQGDASVMKNTSDSGGNVIEFVTSPNNPDGHLRKAILPSANAIYDRAYYWPHFTAIPAPADEDIMIFTISKLTGRAGSRFGWALVKDKDVYLNMCEYLELAEMGVSRDTQLRALQLLKVVLEGDGSEIFHFAYEKMRDRWEKISQTVSFSKRFTIQEIPPQYCNFFEKIRGPSPAYVWLKCEREEDTNCNDVLGAANIIGRSGRLFNSEDRYVRLSLLKSDDDFNLLLYRLKELVTKENGTETMCC
ncbi:tryptophan aminotransferase-related 4-like [Olea europaea subsp. europaea]|uniref:Tryptophan aminotransferase-related 4-like n=1 Tax=Olea europaea subsp. europaea TaxID=158383 RepID=A0A8S0PKJ2_OLEEU|nr:tryptophan aminotransferase-related 4-like [Olea europaea subsp. europaea]